MVAVPPRYPTPGWAGQAELARDRAEAAAASTAADAVTVQAGVQTATTAAGQAASTLAEMLATNFKGPEGPAPLTPLAAWAGAKSYIVGPPASFVSFDGSSWACVVAHVSGSTFDPTKWIVVAARGTDGADGSIDLQTFPAGALLKATAAGLVPAVPGTDYLVPQNLDAGTI